MTPEEIKAYKNALKRLNYDDATRLFLETADNDPEIKRIAFERVKLATGFNPKSTENAYHLLARL